MPDTLKDIPSRPGDGIESLIDAPVVILVPCSDALSPECRALLRRAFAGPGAHVICMREAGNGSSFGAPCLRAGATEMAFAELGGRPGEITALRRPTGWAGQSNTFTMLARQVGAVAQAIGAYRLILMPGSDADVEHQATGQIADMAAAMFDLQVSHVPDAITAPAGGTAAHGRSGIVFAGA